MDAEKHSRGQTISSIPSSPCKQVFRQMTARQGYDGRPLKTNAVTDAWYNKVPGCSYVPLRTEMQRPSGCSYFSSTPMVEACYDIGVLCLFLANHCICD